MPQRVLVVDDYEDNLLLFIEQLRAAGYDVTGTTSPDEALSIAVLTPPDVVVTDISMPGMDGYELGRLLRSNAATRHARLVVVSAHFASSALAPPGGWDAWLVKPIGHGELVNTVRALLDGSDPLAASTAPVSADDAKPPPSSKSGRQVG